MDLVDEKDVPLLQGVGQDGRQVPGLLYGRPGGDPEVYPELVGDDVGQGGLAEAWGAKEEEVLQGLAPGLGGLEVDPELVLQALLADVLV